MAEQRIMVINMRKAIEAVPRYKKAAAASKFMSSFVKRHMKAADVKLDVEVNNEIFKHGIKNPPTRLRVLCAKDDKNVVKIGLIKTEAAAKK